MPEHIHFVTGRLAEHSLRQMVARLAPEVGFEHSISVLNITVAALMTTEWVARKFQVPPGVSRIVLPGYCQGDLAVVQQVAGVPVERGPKDLRELPQFFGRQIPQDYGDYAIEILAEINHAPRWELAELLREADRLRSDGADLIDLGCDPGGTWTGIGACVRALKDRGHRVSVDSYNPDEIEPAVQAGAELVLSVNHTNRQRALDWGCEVVVVPDTPGSLESAQDTIDLLAGAGVRLRIDPVLDPIGFGFAASLERYLAARRRWPDAELMMGIGNLTELTDADSAGINVILLGFCEELGIRSVLTTQVINWACSSVRECDLARRLVHHAVQQRTLPKHVEPRLVMLRDPRPVVFGQESLARMADEIRDSNYRLFAEDQRLHLLSARMHLQSEDAFDLFDQLKRAHPKNLDVGHAFYLGYELAKATTALTLRKQYRQDEALDWGLLTRPERSHRQRSAERSSGRSEQVEPRSLESEPDAREQLSRMQCGYWYTQAIYVAARLGIADLLHAGPRSAEELAAAVNAQPRALYRLLRALASSGIFAEDESGKFHLTPRAALLLDGAPGSVKSVAIMRGDWQYQAWGELLHSVKTGQCAFEKVFGQPLFHYLRGERARAEIFDQAMTAVHGRESEAMLLAYDFSRFATLADIGGGNGSLLRAILERTPHLRGILFDLPDVIQRAQLNLEASGFADRCQTVAGDFFKGVPAGADAYLLRHIVHDWDDKQAIALLRQCRRVMTPHSKLLIAEFIIPPGNEPFFGKWFDLAMMAVPGGLERTLQEYQQLFTQAGLELLRVVPTQTELSILEVVGQNDWCTIE